MSNNVRVEDTVTISKEAYNELMGNSTFLNCLEIEGLFKWDGYERAKKAWREEVEGLAKAS